MTSGEVHREGGYGWVIVVALFLQHVVLVGIQSSTGIIHTELVKAFSADLSVIGWIGSLMLGLCTISSPCVSMLTNLVSCRVLAVTGGLLLSLGFFCAAFTSSVPLLLLCLGVLPGIGMNLILFPSVMILKGYFLKRLPLAYGLCLSGAGVGMVSFPPFYVFLHTTFGIGGSFLICSAICMNCVVFACLTKPVASQKKQSSKGMSMTDLFDVKLFRSHHYNLFLAGHLLLNIAYAVPFTYLPIKGEEAGFSEQSSALFFTGLGTGNAIGRITFGYVSGKFPLIRNRAYIVIVTMVALSTLPVAFTNSYLFILVCSTMFGTCAGIAHTEIPTLLIEMVGIDALPSSLSMTFLQQGIGSLLGIPIAEFICRTLGSNAVAFTFTSGVSALVALLLALSLFLPHNKPLPPKIQQLTLPVTKPEVFIVHISESTGTAAA
uniref:Monocarboxylate transporter 13-like n=1 Tax=Crassostrea virginica TaxID=6565 RepID=A0A8B8EA99_CRAVI|nr:monocarboxylate transporter 13-like [Crassostrea virginica]